jgi:hypothetical protein
MKNLRRRSLVLVPLFLTLAALTPMVNAASNPNPGSYQPGSKPYGLTYGQWNAKWWQWVFSIPTPSNPLIDFTGANCASSQSGPVWFLAGTFGSPSGGGPAVRTCTIPSNKAILFPILNVECSSLEGNGSTLSDFLACDAGFISLVTSINATVDGVPQKDLFAYRFPSPLYSYTMPFDNILGCPSSGNCPGLTTPCPCSGIAAADGYYMMLQPLQAGVHTVSFGGAVPAFSFSTAVVYTLTITD